MYILFAKEDFLLAIYLVIIRFQLSALCHRSVLGTVYYCGSLMSDLFFKERFYLVLYISVHIGGKCGTCPDNSECEQDSCNVYRCRCKLGYANSPDRTQCWKRKYAWTNFLFNER